MRKRLKKKIKKSIKEFIILIAFCSVILSSSAIVSFYTVKYFTPVHKDIEDKVSCTMPDKVLCIYILEDRQTDAHCLTLEKAYQLVSIFKDNEDVIISCLPIQFPTKE